MFGSKAGSYDRLLERATSQLLLEPDWDSIMQICDCIRQEDVQPKHAILALKRKINNDNPHVATFALLILESMVKNCGSLIHEQIASKEFMEYYKETTQKKTDPVRGKMLELLQVWSHAFRNEVSYKIVQDTFNIMKVEGYTFPQLKESDAMFSAERAPEWKDGEVCHRCRTAFSTFNRRHHCRHCGQVFCGKCSSKNSIIPKFGIEREVRVCDACYDMINRAGGKADKEDDLPAEYLASPLSKQNQAPQAKSEQELQEEEELQLALAISQSEAEASKQKKNNYSLYGSTKQSEPVSKAPDPVVTAPTFDTSDMDPELARYLNRNYWQNKSEDSTVKAEPISTTQPSAPVAVSEAKTSMAVLKQEETYQNGEADQPSADQQQFLNALQSSIEIFVNRMKSNHSRGRSIANDSAVQTLFMTISQMHPQLLQYIQEQEDIRSRYENLQDKLAQLKDAREALDVLREEHREKKRREQEEMERLRAIQMAQKLEVLRQKKQEYLEYQRQLTLQRMEEQKHEMMMRLEHQRQMQMQRAMQYGMTSLPHQPQLHGQPGQTMSPAGSSEGSPMHLPHMAHGPYGAPGQPPMGAPPGAPVASIPPQMQIQMATQGPAGMGGPPTGTQSAQQLYSGQPQMQQQPPPPQQQPPPSMGYQPPPPGGYAPAPPVGYHPGQPQTSYAPAATTTGPQMEQQPQSSYIATTTGLQQQPVYSSAHATSDYSSFNMQNVAASLPPGQPPLPGQPNQPQYMGGPPTGQYPAQGGPPTQQMPPQQGMQQPPQMAPPMGQQPLPQQQAPPPQPPPTQGQQDVAQLISFD